MASVGDVRVAPLLALCVTLSLGLAGCTGGGPDDEAPPAAASTPAPSPSPSPSRAAPVDGCPAAFARSAPQPWVPSLPTTETAGRLAPDADPVEVLVCRYSPAEDAGLVGEVVLSAGLEQVRSDLAPQAAPAGGCGTGAGAPHLARLRYADGELWLSGVPGSACAGNGAFVTGAEVGALLAAAHDAGRWPVPVRG